MSLSARFCCSEQPHICWKCNLQSRCGGCFQKEITRMCLNCVFDRGEPLLSLKPWGKSQRTIQRFCFQNSAFNCTSCQERETEAPQVQHPRPKQPSHSNTLTCRLITLRPWGLLKCTFNQPGLSLLCFCARLCFSSK